VFDDLGEIKYEITCFCSDVLIGYEVVLCSRLKVWNCLFLLCAEVEYGIYLLCILELGLNRNAYVVNLKLELCIVSIILCFDG